MIYQGNLVIKKGKLNDFFSHITEITGNLKIYSNNASLPNLIKVGGNIDIDNQTPTLINRTSGGFSISLGENNDIPITVSLPELTNVDGYFYIHGNVKLKADKLVNVGGDIILSNNISLPSLVRVQRTQSN